MLRDEGTHEVRSQFLYAHAKSHHRCDVQPRARAILRKAFHLFSVHCDIKDSFAAGKKGRRRRRDRERKEDRASAPLAVYNSLSMKALTSCPYLLRDAVWKSAFLSDLPARRHDAIAEEVSCIRDTAYRDF